MALKKFPTHRHRHTHTHTHTHTHNDFPGRFYFKRNHSINHVGKIADCYSRKQACVVYI